MPSDLELESIKQPVLEMNVFLRRLSLFLTHPHGKINLVHAGVSVIVHEKLFTKEGKMIH